MRFDVITLFPEMFPGVVQASILRRAQESGLMQVHTHNMRDVAGGVHKAVDDTPYGGGAGMVLRVDILDQSLQKVNQEPAMQAFPAERRRNVLLCAQGERLTQATARRLATDYEQITLVCGHYEGFDERFRGMVDEQISLGDFVLTGGELPAMVLIDSITRLLPEAIRAESPEEESFSLFDEGGQPLLEYPHYTRPAEYKGMGVPEVLLSGNHAEIAKWRLAQAKERSKRRPA